MLRAQYESEIKNAEKEKKKRVLIILVLEHYLFFS